MNFLSSFLIPFPAGLVGGWIVGLIFHEGGHWLAAALVSFQAREVIIGTGPTLVSQRIGETHLQWRRWPVSGLVLTYPIPDFHRGRYGLYLMGGLLGNIVFITLLIWTAMAAPDRSALEAAAVGAITSQIAFVLGQLIPKQATIAGVKVENDGLQLWRLARGRISWPQANQKAFDAMRRRYRAPQAPEQPLTRASMRILFHLSRVDRWADERVRRETHAAFLRELDRGDLQQDEELLVLDVLITDGLLFADPELRPRLDEWSQQACARAPDSKNLRWTRGGVLVELGRFSEARILLDDILIGDADEMNARFGSLFLARAEAAGGNVEKARRIANQLYVWARFNPCDPAIKALIERTRAEISRGRDVTGKNGEIMSGRNPVAPIADPAARAASHSTGAAPKGGFAALTPELDVSSLDESLWFWRDLLGFEIAYDRPAARFAYLQRGPLQVMLCERNGRWETGGMERPFGRGVNFQMTVESLAPILAALEKAGWPLFEKPSEAWYRVGDREEGQREFLVQDPDGYLLRFAENLGERAPTQTP
ncbi:bleomycin resistance protein [Terrirubrum flagellatum]|uniref:bleomycin resistance protein n=1 Tax=Terrirubrum flagellatum TaxID=2895980 RepID=UPI003CC82D6B